jgi:hypothetical protein
VGKPAQYFPKEFLGISFENFSKCLSDEFLLKDRHIQWVGFLACCWRSLIVLSFLEFQGVERRWDSTGLSPLFPPLTKVGESQSQSRAFFLVESYNLLWSECGLVVPWDVGLI